MPQKRSPEPGSGVRSRTTDPDSRFASPDSRTRNPDREYLAFAARAALERLGRVTREIDGVREARDIEFVHRMRVSSRRLRTALRLFEPCFPAKPFRRWQREMRAITRALGRARDLDVQIAAVADFVEPLRDARLRPGVRRLLLRLTQKRERAQRKVLSRLADFQASGASESMAAVLSPLAIQPRCATPSPVLLQDVREWVRHGLNAVLEYEPYVAQARAVKELHSLRIAAKHLRYTLEIVEPLFAPDRMLKSGGRGPGAGDGSHGTGPRPGSSVANPLHPALEAARSVQTCLGTLHDCDVWLEFLPRFLERESKLSLDFHGHNRAFRRLAPGIEHFRRGILRLRRRTYCRFAALWQETRTTRVWEALVETVAEQRPGVGGRETGVRRRKGRNPEVPSANPEPQIGGEREVTSRQQAGRS